MDRRREKFKELDEIEKEAGNLLEELSHLERVPDPSLTPNYINQIKTIQNQMRETILKGIQLNDRDLFLKGLEFYEKNYSILDSIGDKHVCEDYQLEMIQILTDLIVHFKQEINNPQGRYFIIISLQYIAKIYEDAENFERAIEIHLTVSKLLNSWAAAFEHTAVILDYLLLNEIPHAIELLKHFDSLESKIYLSTSDIIEQSIQSKRPILLKEFCENIITATTKDLTIFFEDAKEILDKLDNQENFAFNRVVVLFDLVRAKLDASYISQVPPVLSSQSTTMSSEMRLISKIRDVVIESMESNQPQANSPISAKPINTSTIISELKQFLSESIKNLSHDIISNISKFTPTVSPSYSQRTPSDLNDNIPEIKKVGQIDPNDKPKRPKLADVLGSIIVSE